MGLNSRTKSLPDQSLERTIDEGVLPSFLVPKFKVDHVPTHQISISFSWKNAFNQRYGLRIRAHKLSSPRMVRACSGMFKGFFCFLLAKSPKSLQMDFTSQSPVTSGHCTVWQKHGLVQVPSIAMLQRPLYPCQSGCYALCRGKNLSCSTTHSTDCTHKSRGILVGGVQTVAAIANDECLQVRVRKAHPPEGRSSQHPSAPEGAKTGCSLTP